MQYSIKHLLIWTFVAALVCAVLFAMPSWAGAAIMGLGLLWLPILLTCGLVYARDWRRTFFIGASIAATPVCLPFLLYFSYFVLMAGFGASSADWSDIDIGDLEVVAGVKFVIAVFFAYVACSGVVALFTRWLVSSPSKSVSDRPIASTAQYAVVSGRLVTEAVPQPDRQEVL